MRAETSAQKRRRKSVDRKVRTLMTTLWRRWLASEGDRLLTLNPEHFKPGVKMSMEVRSTFGIGDRQATRSVTRAFKIGEPTKVPTIVADKFLEDGLIIAWEK